MMGFSFTDWHWLQSPWLWPLFAFQVWMLVDAIRREEWFWVVFLILFPILNAILYFFLVYRGAPSLSSPRGFGLPGSVQRGRIKDLERQIQLLDKAHHHLELGDIYFRDGKLAKAEASYRAALERDPGDIDARAHMGQCLLRLGRLPEARSLLEDVCLENQKHDYGHTLMALAETVQGLGDADSAITMWERVVNEHSHARAKVQLAELLAGREELERAHELLAEVLREDEHAPPYQRRQERPWVERAKKLQRAIG